MNKFSTKSSKYKGVHFYNRGNLKSDKDYWIAQYNMPNNKQWRVYKATEREAAIAYDKKMIELGREPINILKKKK